MKNWNKREAVAMVAITPAPLRRGGGRWTVLAAAGTVLAAGLPTGAQATKYVWSSGTYFPGATSPNPLLSGQVLSIETAADKVFASDFTNQSGEVDWLDGFLSLNTVTVTNNSLWRLLNTSSVGFNGGTFVNNGVLRKEATGNFNVRGGFINNGTLDAEAGTISYKGGITFNGGTIFTGAGINLTEGDAAFNGAISSTNLLLGGGTATGTGVNLSGIATFASGELAGDWTIASGSTLSIIGTQVKFISGNLTNNGTVDWQQGFLQRDSADNSSIVNNGVIDVAGGTGFNVALTNNGIIHKYGAGNFNVRGGFINNGTLDAEAGTISYKGGITFNGGTIFTGAGINLTEGDAAFNGAISSTNLLLGGGTATGTGVNLSGMATLASGELAGDWTIASGSTLSIIGTQVKFISGNLTNNGTVDWQQGDVALRDGAAVTNKGTMNILGDGDLIQGSGGGVFVNRGLVTKTSAGDTAFAAPVLNFGTIDVEAGSITLPNGVTNFGTLEGTGTFALADTLTNTGTIAPGALGTQVGTLTLQSGYVQTSAGVLDIQIGSGTLADLFLVSGQARLDGSLALFCASCSVNTGDLFTILDSGGALTGAFASSTASGFNAGFAYTILYDTANTRVQVRVDNAGTAPPGVPEPATWATILFGFGAVGSALRHRSRTTARIRFV